MSKKSAIAVRVLVYLLGLLSIAAGIPKIMQMPQELEFLAALGLGGVGVAIVGVSQSIGGTFLFMMKTRLIGGLLAGTAFLVSSVALLVGGNTSFGMASLIPLALMVVAVYWECRGK